MRAKLHPLLMIVVLLVVVSRGLQAQPPPPPESFATLQLPVGSRVEFKEFASAALGGKGQYSIFLPAAYDQHPTRTFPVIYFLHGMFNDHGSWTQGRYGNLPLAIESLLENNRVPPFLMVHPNGENSFYTNTLNGARKYEEYICGDLIRETETRFRARATRSDRVIAGTSMGGYGALKIAMKHPHLYSSVAAGSPIIFLGEDPSRHITSSSSRLARFFTEALRPVFGIPFDSKHWKENSVEVLARTRDIEHLNIYMAYGTGDRYLSAFPMERGIRKIDMILKEREIAHVFRVYEGDPHGWKFIRKHIEQILEFLTQTF